MFGKRIRDRKTICTIGWVALILHSLSLYNLHHRLGVSEQVADPVNGFLLGVAIAAMLLGVRAKERARSGTQGGSCA